MKRICWILLFALFIMVGSGVGFSQDHIINTGFPVPSYVKRGLVIYYDAGGYVLDQKGKHYVTFKKIILVQTVEGEDVIGTIYSINSGSQMMTTETKLLGHGGSGLFYIHPDYAKKMKGKEEGGFKFGPSGIIKYASNDIEGTIEYDPKTGLFLGQKVKAPNTESEEIYKGYEYTELPPLPSSFPQIVKSPYTYSTYTVIQNFTTPLGTLSISPISFKRSYAVFRLDTQVYGGVNSTQKVYGTTLIGPHYINPLALKDGFSLVALKKQDVRFYIQGSDEYGKIAHFVVDGIEFYKTHIDPQSGLVVSQDQFMVGMGTAIRLILNR